MDVTRLYNLTTRELQLEAQDLGIDDAQALSRAQLIRAIRDRSSDQRDGFLGKVFGIARWAIQEASRPSEPPPPPPRESTQAPTGVFSGRTTAASAPVPTGGGYEEPFPTRTMARILAGQGHYKRALAIYQRLAQDSPLDASLREELEQTQKSARKALRVAHGAP